MQELIIGLGSNLGNRRENIEKAISIIQQKVGQITAISSFVETEPWGFESENKFLNCVIVVSDETPFPQPADSRMIQIIKILQSIEMEFGRVRTGVYTDRAIDLDILFYGDEILNEKELTVPHPKLHERDFILVSLMEVCPEKIHPVIGKTIRKLFEESS